MRIGIISTIYDSPWEGCEELWTAMAGEALSDGHDVAISVYHWSSTPPKIASLQQKGAQVLKRYRPKSSMEQMFARVMQRAVRELRPGLSTLRLVSSFNSLFRFKPDVICINQGGTYDSLALNDLRHWLYASSIPYIVVCHVNSEGDFGWRQRCREEAIEFFARAQCVGFVSLRNLKVTERQIAATLNNACVVRNPINLADLSVAPWSMAQEPVKLACVARLATYAKSQDVLFETLSSETWHNRNWILRLYGKGKDKDYLMTLAQHYGISERVEFRGFAPDVRAIWADNHLLVLPSRFEGTPLTLIEAMLCGRPSVVTDVGGNAEWVEESHTGFVAEAPTAKSFGAALERAWANKANWENMGRRAHEYALYNLDRSPGRSLLKIVTDAACSSRKKVESQHSASDARRALHAGEA